MNAPLLAIDGLHVVSENRSHAPILREVSLTLRAGQVMGLVGESGAGKTTIGKAVLGMLPRTLRIARGEVRFAGRNLLALPAGELRHIIGNEIALIPQDPQTSLNPLRRIGSQLTDGLRLRRGLTRKAALDRAADLLADVHINDPQRVLRAFPHELSGGMRQRVLIASAFALEPRLIVADEPTTALDVTVQKQILRLIRRMQEAHGTAVLFVTHDLGVVAQVCDQVTLLLGGRIVESGAVSSVFASPSHPYTRALIEAVPRYDRPQAGLRPVPPDVLELVRRELETTE